MYDSQKYYQRYSDESTTLAEINRQYMSLHWGNDAPYAGTVSDKAYALPYKHDYSRYAPAHVVPQERLYDMEQTGLDPLEIVQGENCDRLYPRAYYVRYGPDHSFLRRSTHQEAYGGCPTHV